MIVILKESLMKINSVGGAGRPSPNMDPDAYAKMYALQNGITVEQAKTELRAKFGDPEKPQQV